MHDRNTRKHGLPISKVLGMGLINLALGFLTVSHVLAESAELYVTDALTFPGHPVQLQARLSENDGSVGQTLSGEELEFFVQGRLVGRSTTDDQGWARIEYIPKMRGNLELLVKRITPSKVDAIQGKGRLLSWERRRPILLVDIAVLFQTSPPPPEGFPVSGLRLGEPQESAAAELGKLAEFYYNLVYLDLTGKGELETVHVWLRKHHFPPGRIQILSNKPESLPDILRQLKEEGWENVSGGIGQSVSFAEVLLKNRLQTVIVAGTSSAEKFPRRAVLLPDWSRVRRYL